MGHLGIFDQYLIYFIAYRSPSDFQQSLIFYEMSQLNIIGVFQRFLDQNVVIKVSEIMENCVFWV